MTDDELARIERVVGSCLDGSRHADEVLHVLDDVLRLVAEVRRLRRILGWVTSATDSKRFAPWRCDVIYAAERLADLVAADKDALAAAHPDTRDACDAYRKAKVTP